MASILELYEGLTPLKMDDDLYNIYDFLRRQNLDFPSRKTHSINKKAIIDETRQMMEEYFIFMPILYVNKKFLSLANKSPFYAKELRSKVLNHAKLVYPFALPTSFDFSEIIECETNMIKAHDENGKAYYFFMQIVLKYFNDLIATSCYAHEIAHTQVTPDILQNYYNSEVISIFMEKLIAFNKSQEAFKMIEAERLKGLLMYCNTLLNPFPTILGSHIVSTYITSNLKAEKLFDIYINSSEADKTLIIDATQYVFFKKHYVEDMLDCFDISEENSFNLDAIKRNNELARRRS